MTESPSAKSPVTFLVPTPIIFVAESSMMRDKDVNVGGILGTLLDHFAERHLAEEQAGLQNDPNVSVHERDTLSSLGPENEWARRAFGLGEEGLRLAEELIGSEPGLDYLTQDALDPGGSYHFLARTGLQVAAARRVAADLSNRLTRASDLVWFALENRPSEAVAKYCRHLGRCYVAGLEPECIILCRSVLDAVLKDLMAELPETAIAQSEVMRGKRHGLPGSLHQRILVAEELGVMSRTQAEAAMTIKNRGNTAVHHDPEATGQVFETVKMAMELVGGLLSREGA